MAIKTIVKRLDKMKKGDIFLKNNAIRKNNQYQIVEKFKDNKIVIKSVDNGGMKVYNSYGYRKFRVLANLEKAKK